MTRIEGHAKISIHLNDDHSVADARFHVGEFRGFEKFCEGRPLWEMPGLTARICGICPVSHLIASARAGDAILAATVPPAAEQLRRLMNLAQIVQSHALSFFHLSGPDLLLGFDADPSRRNLLGLAVADREAALRGIRLRQFGQEIIELLGGKRIHPSWCVPGGVRSALSSEGRAHIKARLPEAKEAARYALDRMKGLIDTFSDETASFGNFPTLYLGLVAADGAWEHYGGRVRVLDADGAVLVDGFEAGAYREFIGEAVQPDSYLKSPYFRPLGHPGGMYRVGPLARLNLCERMGTPLADAELVEYRQRGGRIVSSSFWYHYARLIEIMAGVELIERLIDDPGLGAGRLRAEAGINAPGGVGVGEAPRGTLFHHYEVDEDGLVRSVNLIIATGQNNLAMNATVAQIARRYISGPAIPEGVLNRLEAGIRAFDPCLSCSTHALGQMPMVVRLVGPDGSILDEARRD
ncbi:NAD-reducing hydrogenase HoxS subunit beta [Tautonia plasticadhaerens]|uniref:NAD-reducing hydrogenase HoxS subunit beta n=1 Tax=Tautonia plasticadhaerens TaxID=2527974 RepID=A0A518H3G8_9BACT|nr:NAD-reducing hydrogenase HoxS subunit beta [Tautonia plasticadhaerens]